MHSTRPTRDAFLRRLRKTAGGGLLACLLVAVLALAWGPTGLLAAGGPAMPASDLPLELPGPATPTAEPDVPGAGPAENGATSRAAGGAAYWRQLADTAAARGAYGKAAEYYRNEAAAYHRLGDHNAAEVEERKANRFSTDVSLYLVHPTTAADSSRLNTGARLEPPVGCYVGAFIDRDDNVESYPLDSQRYGSVRDFTRRVGKKHASFFMYRTYGEPFPEKWVNYVREHGAIPDIAWEPRDLSQVRNDAYLQSWVAGARRCGPIFLRFASEFNGPWVRYHGNPAAYRQAFRLVYKAFRQAPYAALIWCPNTVPRQEIDAYYPGDDATDWVGVNFYSVVYEDNKADQRADYVHPADMIDYVYKKYAARKPMAVGEWAATHQSSVDNANYATFAQTKIAQLYGSLMTRYPRIKLVNWYDCNNLTHAKAGRQLNDFSITGDSNVQTAYREQVSAPWFLGARELQVRGSAPLTATPLQKDMRVAAGAGLDAWVRTYVQRPHVYFKVDGKVVLATANPGRHSIPLDAFGPGRHTIDVAVFDDKNRCAATAHGTIIR